jgi:hypothetical protein
MVAANSKTLPATIAGQPASWLNRQSALYQLNSE